ncbi:tryptophan--tRNA ligase, partial [Candidatus Saccharibacteria bacterium]|nr:tryptophan--tRNA ligase [Candidatus Saccharibacteria bacterium]
MKTILTGLRANSVLTLGNYLGALLPMVRLANRHSKDSQVNIFVPDLHSIISEVDGSLTENTIRSLKYYLAAGLEVNENVHIYRQSRVPA